MIATDYTSQSHVTPDDASSPFNDHEASSTLEGDTAPTPQMCGVSLITHAHESQRSSPSYDDAFPTDDGVAQESSPTLRANALEEADSGPAIESTPTADSSDSSGPVVATRIQKTANTTATTNANVDADDDEDDDDAPATPSKALIRSVSTATEDSAASCRKRKKYNSRRYAITIYECTDVLM